jgi:hypothetical protein
MFSDRSDEDELPISEGIRPRSWSLSPRRPPSPVLGYGLFLPGFLLMQGFRRHRRLVLLFFGDLLSGLGYRVQYCINWHIQKLVAQTLHFRRKKACLWDF